MNINLRRSVLYVPGANERALAGVFARGADCLIFDLEDAVAPSAKDAARANLAGILGKGDDFDCEIVVRVNALGSDPADADLEMVAAVRPDGVLLPKIDGRQDVERAVRAIERAGIDKKTRLWLMVETPLAIMNIAGIAACAAFEQYRLEVLVIGGNDLYTGMRARQSPGRGAIAGLLNICVAAARAHGLDVIDGVFNDYSDARSFAAECEQGRDFGMDGKSLIHPAQIGICNRIFSPSADELEWARAVTVAFALPQNAGKGAIALKGAMVERLHLANAERIIALAGKCKKVKIHL